MDNLDINGDELVRPRDRELAQRLDAILLSFDHEKRSLPGIKDFDARDTFVSQILDSIHRVSYSTILCTQKLSERRADPNDRMFDPLRAAVIHQRQGHIDEAFWLVFLFVHFGKHPRAGWQYTRDVYGRLGDGVHWDWASISANPAEFRNWLHTHQNELKRGGDVRGGFGNHRKYISLSAYSPNGTGDAFESYVMWVGTTGSHQDLINRAYLITAGDSREAFDYLYRSMSSVASFGRVARFDYLAMVGKLGLASIEPGSAYLKNSTGPLRGARMLLGGHKEAPLNPADLDNWLVELDVELKVGMQVLEDALCNWQKSPRNFKRFLG